MVQREADVHWIRQGHGNAKPKKCELIFLHRPHRLRFGTPSPSWDPWLFSQAANSRFYLLLSRVCSNSWKEGRIQPAIIRRVYRADETETGNDSAYDKTTIVD
jgi:hypothetical protein